MNYEEKEIPKPERFFVGKPGRTKMKIGDRIYHKKYAGLATVIQVNVETTSDIRRGKVVKTTYVAVYPDGRPITFHGFNIGKTIFKHVPIGTQTSMFDSIEN